MAIVHRAIKAISSRHNCDMMDSMMNNVIALNNQGVQLLKEARAVDAVALFQQAVVELRSLSESMMSRSRSGSRTTNDGDTFLYRRFIFERKSDNSASHKCGDDYFYVYDCPLILPPTAILSSDDDYIDGAATDATMRAASATVLFNMALACHLLHGNSSGAGHDAVTTATMAPWTRAAQLYDLVLQVLDDEDDDDNCDCHHCYDDPSLTALKCLVLNNRARLHYEWGEYQECLDCLQLLMDAITDSSTDCMPMPLECCIDADQVAEIIANIMHVQPPTTAAAA